MLYENALIICFCFSVFQELLGVCQVPQTVGKDLRKPGGAQPTVFCGFPKEERSLWTFSRNSDENSGINCTTNIFAMLAEAHKSGLLLSLCLKTSDVTAFGAAMLQTFICEV